MLDFKWKNGQAPSLNASNMQLITDAINSNEAKIKDIESEVAEIVIEHGGSIVIPNPEEEATDTLSKVKINQEVFEIEGGGDSGEDISYEDYMALVAADEDEENKNYFVPDAPIGIPVAEEFEKVYEEINYIKHDVQEIEDKKAENTTLTDVFDATKSYSVGDYFISNNQLFKVKVACSGITPPNSTYYDSITVMNELKASLNDIVNGNITVNIGSPNDSLNWIMKNGKVVTCSIYIDGVTTTGSWQTIATLPFKPVKTFYVSDNNGNRWGISNNGSISKGGTVSNQTIAMYFSYLTND